MKKLVVIALPLVLLACSEPAVSLNPTQAQAEWKPSPAFRSREAMRRAASLALEGDGEAARELSIHFAFVGPVEQSNRWQGVAIANGSRQALEDASIQLAESQDACLRRRGQYIRCTLLKDTADPICQKAGANDGPSAADAALGDVDCSGAAGKLILH